MGNAIQRSATFNALQLPSNTHADSWVCSSLKFLSTIRERRLRFAPFAESEQIDSVGVRSAQIVVLLLLFVWCMSNAAGAGAIKSAHQFLKWPLTGTATDGTIIAAVVLMFHRCLVTSFKLGNV